MQTESQPTRVSSRRKGLNVFFAPKSVAVIGATDRAGHIGRMVLWNLISNPFGGTVYPVNPRRKAVLGIRAYPTLSSIPEQVDLAVVVTPAETLPQVISECGGAGVSGAVVISAGFRETGARGVQLEQEVLRAARAGGVRLIGPNCLGVMCPGTGLNATFAPAMARPGNVGLISQSGAICTALLDWSLREQFGFSAFVSVGSMVDVGWGDLIDHLGNDSRTQSIVIYMESVGDARSFLSAAREVALNKPILVIKAGRTESAAKASVSHTGTMTGSDDVLDAAFRRVGVLRIHELEDVFHVTEVLARQRRPAGPKLTVVTNAGGPGILATDALLGLGAELAPLMPETVASLDRVLPKHWSGTNPVDVIGDAGPDRYAKAVEAVAADANTDGLLVIMAPQGLSDPVAIAEAVTAYAHLPNKPILASWMGGRSAAEGEAILNRAGIPTFPFPNSAVRAFNYMWRYSYNLRALYETPELAEIDGQAHVSATEVIEQARREGRTLLTEWESKRLLSIYGIPVAKTEVARTQEEAVAIAERLGFPVVLKLHSYAVTHKAAVGGVQLSLRSSEEVRRAFWEIRRAVAANVGEQHFAGVTVQPMVSHHGYELIVGSTIDPQFGPALLFGAGGALAEIWRDRAVALPPLNTTLARRMMEQTRIYRASQGQNRGPGIPSAELERFLVRFAQLVLDQTPIREIDINPLIASENGLCVLDARVVIYAPDVDLATIPKPAIRPYPAQYIDDAVAGGSLNLIVRPIRPEDEPAIVRFHSTLSEQTVYRRYFELLKLENRIQHERLTRMCFIDYDRQMAFVAQLRDAGERTGDIVGVARLIKAPTGSEAELAAVVSDAFQGRGIGSLLVRHLLRFARDEKLQRITATVLPENSAMQRLLERHGFVFTGDWNADVQEGELRL